MARRLLCVAMALSLLGEAGMLDAQAPPSDPELTKGIRQVDEGDYDGAIFTLDATARRLATDPGRVKDLSQAYLYLGIAYFGKGHEAAAKAKFREAVSQIKDLTLSPEKFPPKVINLFEAAKEEVARPGPVPSPSSSPESKPVAAPAKKGGGGKGLLIAGLVVAAGAGVALAAKGGGGSSTPSVDTSRHTINNSGSVGAQEQRFFQFFPTKAGTVNATVTWQDPSIALSIGVEEKDPPYTDVGAASQPTATSATITASVVVKGYNVIVSNFSNKTTPESFTITILYP